MARVLRNTTARRQSFVLPHEVICTEDACYCTITRQGGRVHNPDTGEYGTSAVDTRVPAAIHIPAKSRSGDLPDSVLQVPSVADAIKRGLLIAD